MNRSILICRSFVLAGILVSVLLNLAMLGCKKKTTEAEPSWRDRLQQTQLTTTDFSQVIADGIAETIADADVRVEGALTVIIDQEAGESKCDLTNLWQDCRDNVDARSEIVDQYLTMMKSTLAQLGEKRPLKIDDIVPLIKGSKWLAESDSQGMNVHRENVAADLFVVYGEDGPDYLRFVNRDAYAELGLSAKVMRATALDNLRARLPKIERFGEGPVYMLAAGGTFESSLLLMPEVWKDVDEAVDGRVIAATPSRDLLMFTGENALEAISEMRQMAEKIHRDGNYLVSKELLMLSDGVWERLPSPDDVPKLRLESQTAP